MNDSYEHALIKTQSLSNINVSLNFRFAATIIWELLMKKAVRSNVIFREHF